MGHYLNGSCRCLCVVLVATLLPIFSLAQGTLAGNRDLMRRIADGTANVIAKNFYDPSLNGVDMQKLLNETKQKINESTKVTEMNAAIYWMVQKMNDSHTNFMPPLLTLDPRFGFKAKPYGDTVRVYEIKEKSPAAKAGLRLGDTIVGLDGIAANRKTYWQTQFFYRFIQPAGAMVLDLQRDGRVERLTLEADIRTRRAIDYAYDFSRVFDWIREEETFEQENPFLYAKKDELGYVKIRDFEGYTPENVLLKVKDATGLIIDLRGNPGGWIRELQRFAGYFDSEPTEIGEEVYRNKSEKLVSKPQHPSFSGVPLAVLVDSESASATEIFARHLQLRGRAVIIGDKTMGAVSGARAFPQKIGADPAVFYGVQTTVVHLVFSDGHDLEKVGVTPDTMCIPTADDLAAKKDPCFEVAVAALKAKIGKGNGPHN